MKPDAPVRATDSAAAIEATLERIGASIYARDKTLPVLERGCPEWRAWRAWRIAQGLPVNVMDARQRWTVPLRSPPEDLEAAEVEYAQGSNIAALLKEADGS